MKKMDLPIGVENFKEATKKYYIDKTLMIKDLIERGEGKAILLTRPRRFGKSLALSMVDYYFNIKENSSNLFIDKQIKDCGDNVLNKMNKYPVVHLNMKGVEYSETVSILDRTRDKICMLYREFPELLNSDKLSEVDRKEFSEIYNKTANDVLMISSLGRLTMFLYKHYGKRVILLIDEYDSPIESSYENGCYDLVMDFFKPLYSDALKGNDYLYFALISGVLQISKESLFSGLNNLMVASINNSYLSKYFGFSEFEVKNILADYELSVDYQTINRYYGGYYLPDGEMVCNPWSILNFVEERRLKTYWANTGTNELLMNIINLEHSSDELLDFLNNSSKKALFNPAISYKDLNGNAGASLSFLAQTGYLTIFGDYSGYQEELYEFRIPNQEIYDVFRLEIIGRTIPDTDMSIANKLKESILERDNDRISNILNEYLLSSLSPYDLKDERNYHNAVTGILSVLFDRYIVKNEINTGTGRCDIIMIPKNNNQPGIIVEIKQSKSKTQLSKARLTNLANKAIEQIKQKDYPELLRKNNCANIYLFGFAFQNKSSIIVSEEYK